MKLCLREVDVRDIQFGEITELQGGVLTINKKEALDQVFADDRIIKGDLDIAKPGESIRIIPVKDVIEPRVKIEGQGDVFPGTINKVDRVGEGVTLALKGMSVITVGRVVGFQEGVFDMSGPGAKWSPYSSLNNLVLIMDCKEGLTTHQREETFRIAGLKLADYIAKKAKDVKADREREFQLFDVSSSLPRIVYVYMLQSQGLLHDTYVYGVDAKQLIPTLIHPNEVLDGAIVSGNCVAACDKVTTYQHLNNPVIEDLYALHGKKMNFAGVIITNENVVLADKIRSSDFVAKLAKLLKADGAIITEEGYGNPDTDLMMNCKKLETIGVPTVLITDECCGRDGSSQSLADGVKEATAIVSTGNVSELITLPPMEKVLGDLNAIEVLAGGYKGSLNPDGSITFEVNAMLGATSQVGYSYLTLEDY